MSDMAGLYPRTQTSAHHNTDVAYVCPTYTAAELGNSNQCGAICPGGTVGVLASSSGTSCGTCAPCAAGTYRPKNLFSEICAKCPGGKVSSTGENKCELCSVGKQPLTPSICEDCPLGRTGQSGQCDECSPGYFAVSKDPADCMPCTDLLVPQRFHRFGLVLPKLGEKTVCPGGAPGSEARLCPLAGLWTHYDDSDLPPQLLVCETKGACVTLAADQDCKKWLRSTHMATAHNIIGAECSSATTGFMCTQCADGYSKVGGQCVVCDGVDWAQVVFWVVSQTLTSLFLL